MSAEEENKRLALIVIEALNARDLDPWSQNLSDNYVAEYPGVPVLNKTQSLGYNRRFVIAFPDTHFQVHSVVAQGDQVYHTLDGERHPNRAARHSHGEDHPTYQAQGDSIGCPAYPGEGRRDRA